MYRFVRENIDSSDITRNLHTRENENAIKQDV